MVMYKIKSTVFISYLGELMIISWKQVMEIW